MNCCWILLLLLFCGNNGCGRQNDHDDRDCGCERDRNDSCRDSRRSRDCDNDSCSCNDSRFEPRFESRPFGGSTCGCEEK